MNNLLFSPLTVSSFIFFGDCANSSPFMVLLIGLHQRTRNIIISNLRGSFEWLKDLLDAIGFLNKQVLKSDVCW